MSVISVYRIFYWTESRLAGQTGHIWETKEEQARCIKDPHDPTAVGAPLVAMPSYIPPTKDQQRRDARYHISSQNCLCGIHGYFSPDYLGLVTTTTGKVPSVDHEGDVVYTRVRLGGLVDIHSMGARGEYGLIEEAWCDDDLAEAVAKQYDIPVNQSEFNNQPRTDPIIDKDAKVTKLSSMFTGLPEAVTVKGMYGPNSIPGAPVGLKTTLTQKIQKIGGPPVGSAFGQAITFQQYMALVGGRPSPLSNLFSVVSPGPGPASGGSAGPKHSVLCPAASGASANCQCGICARVGLPRTPLCRFTSGHTMRKCLATMPKIVPVVKVAPTIKPGIVTRIKRKLNRWGLGV